MNWPSDKLIPWRIDATTNRQRDELCQMNCSAINCRRWIYTTPSFINASFQCLVVVWHCFRLGEIIPVIEIHLYSINHTFFSSDDMHEMCIFCLPSKNHLIVPCPLLNFLFIYLSPHVHHLTVYKTFLHP